MDRNDLISRSELKSVLKNECFWCANRDEPCDKSCWRCINEKIDNAPTVKTYCYFCGQTEHGVEERPQGEWVSVSEKLPDKNMRCLVSVGKFNFTEIAMYSDLMGTINHKIFWQGDYGKNNFQNITEYVNAWQPLPEPYQKGGADMRQTDEPDKQITLEEYMNSMKGEKK